MCLKKKSQLEGFPSWRDNYRRRTIDHLFSHLVNWRKKLNLHFRTPPPLHHHHLGVCECVCGGGGMVIKGAKRDSFQGEFGIMN